MGCSSSANSTEHSKKRDGNTIDIYKKYFNTSENPYEYIIKDFSLSQESFFDFLESIYTHRSIEVFKMENIVLNSIY